MSPDVSTPSLLRVLVDRCSELEATQTSLRAQLDELAAEEEITREKVQDTSFSGGMTFPGKFRNRSLYEHVLQSVGHAVYVSRVPTGEIIFWNYSAERLYGWKDCEAIGRCFFDLLIEEEYAPSVNKIMEKLRFGQSWSGKFPFKKRTGEIFMAIVTKSPMYEDGRLVGVITVSSDAAVLNVVNNSNEQPTRVPTKRIQWHQRPQIASVPQMASSISNLASKVLSRKPADVVSIEREGSSSDAEDSYRSRQGIDVAKSTGEGNDFRKEESVIAQPAKIAAKLLEKMQIKSGNKNAKTSNGSVIQKANCVSCCQRGSSEATSNIPTVNIRGSSFPGKRIHTCKMKLQIHECFEVPKVQSLLPTIGVHVNCESIESELENAKATEIEDSGDSRASSHESSSTKGENESSSMVDSDICWEDIKLGEKVGQGSYAAVYHGLWNGSDVAVKVYFGKDYNEGTLLDYKKEIDIMRRLRHPNVLLFMGACCSQDRLAIVTEFLPRGSLFKILHRSNQMLDIRRRLKMALDVAKGMNYLHRRHPPIVHRDLKSSNLLVDKNWTVKVGDFGLSKLKHATFLTAKSGGGTPQWMAPEVLRSDPSNEKSDVFSFGVILWELVTVSIPWASLDALQVVGVVGFMDRRLDIDECIDPRISSIITDCWQTKPELRPSFQDIIERMMGIIQSIPSSVPNHIQRNPSS